MNAPMTPLTQSFDPSADARALRTALGSYATGVTVVTCQTADGPLGIAANSFASVSLDPPLVLWSPAKSSSRYTAFVEATHFAIHVLGADHMEICRGFARDGRAFDALSWAPGEEGVPLLDTFLARFECRREAVHDAGDHSIIVARVSRVTTTTGDAPLVFQGGRYGEFTQTS